jgi:hypothetical protein
MPRYTKMDNIKDLILSLNEKRSKEGKVAVSRQWTGLGHWLKTEEENYKSLGGIFTSDDKFIGFLEGLLFEE